MSELHGTRYYGARLLISHCIGFWKEEARNREAARVEVLSYVDEEWGKTFEAKACIAFMKAGTVTEMYMGFACNRLSGERLGTGDCICPLGKWTFPEKWEDYIENHSVKPMSEEFIKDAVQWYSQQIGQ